MSDSIVEEKKNNSRAEEDEVEVEEDVVKSSPDKAEAAADSGDDHSIASEIAEEVGDALGEEGSQDSNSPIRKKSAVSFDLEGSLEESINSAIVIEGAGDNNGGGEDEGTEGHFRVPIYDREATPEEVKAATMINVMGRIVGARKRMRDKARTVYEQVFDAENNRYFFFNKKSGESAWVKPKIFGSESLDPKDEWATVQLQKMYRKKMARRHLGDMSKQWFEKSYDPDSKQFYYVRKVDNTTRWEKPMFIAKGDDANLGEDSKKFLDRDDEIARLKKLLEEKEKEIVRAEQSRFEDLDNKLRNQRLLEAKTEPRGKHMDEWTMPEVVAWFESLGFPEYEPAIIEHKVDGLLLLNMEEQDWTELGVTSRLHARKIEVNMKKYRMRFENKEAKGDKGEDGSSSEDSGLSDLSISSDPSDLLEELQEGEEGSGDEHERSVEEDEDDLPPTEEELLEKKRDKENVSIEELYPGDGKSHPKNGDVVQLHYTAMLADGKVIESSRKMRHRPFEFVVGTGQVIRGWDVAIKQFSFGERSKVSVTAKYAYGSKGFPPTIPPNADLLFDLELIKWWRRPVWVKPLIQQPGLSQKPYTKEEEERSGGATYGDASKVQLDSAKKEDDFSDSGSDDG